MNNEEAATTEGKLRRHWYAVEETKESEKRHYDETRATRRLRSKATVIGLFSNAKQHIYALKTVSGAEDSLGFFEIYRDVFCEYLEAQGCKSDESYSSLLSSVNGYEGVGDFMCSEMDVSQKMELAAFGLVLYDRLLRAAENRASYVDFFLISSDLSECVESVSVGFSIRERAHSAALARHAKDPKQADKLLVRECWDDWQKVPARYHGKAAFARDMRDKFPNLKSQPVIEGWCRQWERET